MWLHCGWLATLLVHMLAMAKLVSAAAVIENAVNVVKEETKRKNNKACVSIWNIFQKITTVTFCLHKRIGFQSISPHLELDQLATLDSMLLVRRFTRFNPSIKHGLQKNSNTYIIDGETTCWLHFLSNLDCACGASLLATVLPNVSASRVHAAIR